MSRGRLIDGLVVFWTTLAVALGAPAIAGAAAVPGCARAGSAGGDWPTYGGALDNARDQIAEHRISTANVGSLAKTWEYTTPDGGTFQSTPIEADGCIFMGSSTGNVVALNADTGQQVWSAALGSNIVGAPAVTDGIVVVNQDKKGAITEVGLNETTGAIVWQTPITSWPDTTVEAAPVPYDGMVFQGFEGDETGDHGRGGYTIFDAASGKILASKFTISDAEYAAGYRGASITDTAAVDVANGYAYVGTGNPASAPQQAPESNAILKIDLNPARPTFGQIVGDAPGTPEQYVVNQTPPSCVNDSPYPANRVSCNQLDYDYIASPNLFGVGTRGQTLIGDIQKSGIYHAYDAGTLKEAWSTTLGPGCLACAISSPAYDQNAIYAATLDGNLFALDKATGAIKWATAATGIVHFQALTVANGVLYSINEAGLLEAYNTSSGLPLLKRPFMVDENTYTYDGGNSDGISVARDTVYVAHASHLLAYRTSGSGAPAGAHRR